MEGLQLHVVQRLVKHGAGQREEMTPEGQTAADRVLPQPGLGFVHAQRHCLAHRRAVMSGIESLLVESVPDLVQYAEEGVAKIARAIARGDAVVARTDAAEEW